jgi:serine/threonine-protein kinase
VSPSLANDRHIGRVIKDTYVLEAKVGVGGFGAVYRARHLKLGSSVAMKFLLPHADDLARQRFEREARIAAAIVHPNVARVIDIDHDDEGSPYMVIEWIEGQSLRGLINDRGSLSFAEVVELFHQFGSAMDAAHAKGVVHRDLKPENLLLSEESGVVLLKVLDFGIARQEGSAGTLTHGVAIGTPCYMAPESARVGSSSADRRVDIYAMGLLLYECLSGRRAIEGEPMQIFALQLTTGVTIPSVLATKPNLPPGVDDVIAIACAREPEGRYQSAGEMAAALAAVPPTVDEGAPVLRGMPMAGVTSPKAALTPASLTPLKPAPIAIREMEAPPEEETPEAPVYDPEPAHAALSEDSLAVSDLPPLQFKPKRTGLKVAAALVVVGGIAFGAWFANSHDLLSVGPVDETKDKPATAKLEPSQLVHFKMKNAPAGAKAFDADRDDAPIQIENGSLVLPRGIHAIRLRLEAPGYQKISMQVVPDADGDIDFGAMPAN